MAEAAAVYITNRFSQQVVAASEAGLGMEDRLGAGSVVSVLTQCNRNDLNNVGTNDEKWVFNSDGSIQNVATGQYLRSVTLNQLPISHKKFIRSFYSLNQVDTREET